MSGMADVLAAHMHMNASKERYCQCGAYIGDWATEEDFAAHQAAMLAAAGFGLMREAQAAAFDQGQKSGIRHATRLAAAVRLGRPELPGPISPNPYRAVTVRGGE